MAVCTCVHACVCVCNVSWHWEKAFRPRHVSGLSLFGVWSVSLHLWMSVFIPVAPAARTVGPHVQWSQTQAGHAVSPPTLWSPGPPQPYPLIPLVEPQPTHGFIHPSPNRHCKAVGPGAQILTPNLTIWTHRCQGRCTPAFTAPAPHFRRSGRLAFLHLPVCPAFGARLGGGASEETSELLSRSPLSSCPSALHLCREPPRRLLPSCSLCDFGD